MKEYIHYVDTNNENDNNVVMVTTSKKEIQENSKVDMKPVDLLKRFKNQDVNIDPPLNNEKITLTINVTPETEFLLPDNKDMLSFIKDTLKMEKDIYIEKKIFDIIRDIGEKNIMNNWSKWDNILQEGDKKTPIYKYTTPENFMKFISELLGDIIKNTTFIGKSFLLVPMDFDDDIREISDFVEKKEYSDHYYFYKVGQIGSIDVLLYKFNSEPRNIILFGSNPKKLDVKNIETTKSNNKELLMNGICLSSHEGEIQTIQQENQKVSKLDIETSIDLINDDTLQMYYAFVMTRN
jgi:hypothetical protein